MSSFSPILPTNEPAHQAVIIPFNRVQRTQRQFQPCIFCGKTIKVHKFKGKTVCIQCLHQIPAIFSFG
ncbi:MAG: hypothetical protein Q8912_09480 [Bacillota bacterium]|nr:hypothetical protein [Bacillota bacterium]MDP4159931.1 hypothetical protein [Bacillota bacterium]